MLAIKFISVKGTMKNGVLVDNDIINNYMKTKINN